MLSHVFYKHPKPKALLLFVHGSPGSWHSFEHSLKQTQLTKHFSILIPDRPGYGTFQKQGSAPSLSKQADMLLSMLDHEIKSGSPDLAIVLIGHSYGGPLISQMAVQMSKQNKRFNTQALFYIAASVDPSLEKTKRFQYPAQWRALKWLIPRKLVHCNEEILALKQDLLTLEPHLHNIDKKIAINIIHGSKDKLVPIANIDYLKKHFADHSIQITVLNKEGHFIPWSHKHLIAKTILDQVIE